MPSPRPTPISPASNQVGSPSPVDERDSKDHELTVLALRARAGVPGALDTLFTRTRADVARFIAVRVDATWVEDLTQETFTRALTGLSRYTGRAPILVWLFSVARHTVADRYRAERRRPVCEPLEHALRSRDMAAVGRFDEHLALLSLVCHLTEERRTAFTLTQICGLPYAEAAALTEAPIGTVRSRVARGRRDLADMLHEAASEHRT